MEDSVLLKRTGLVLMHGAVQTPLMLMFLHLNFVWRQARFILLKLPAFFWHVLKLPTRDGLLKILLLSTQQASPPLLRNGGYLHLRPVISQMQMLLLEQPVRTYNRLLYKST